MRYSRKKVVIVGGSGFIGTQLALRLMREGAHVTIIDPRPSPIEKVTYIKSDLKHLPDFEALHTPFAVFNLAGVPIFGRWTKEYKKIIRSSRIDTTRALVNKFKNPLYRPEFFVSTSAIGVYGDRGDEMLEESSNTIPNTYLAQVAQDWENEALQAKESDVKVRIIRNAHVLGQGGLLSIFKKIFMCGVGGPIGSGKQFMTFVSIERCVEAYTDAPFTDTQIKNAVSIYPLTNRDFSKKVAQALFRPCFFWVPVWALRLVYGEFADEIVASQRVYTQFDPSFEDTDQVIRENL